MVFEENNISIIELFKEEMKFSSGHFTIFSKINRENLHGHNFNVYVALKGIKDKNGMLADYGPYKSVIKKLCSKWNEFFLLPGESPFLIIKKKNQKLTSGSMGKNLFF